MRPASCVPVGRPRMSNAAAILRRSRFWEYLLALALPMVALCLAFAADGIFPFGTNGEAYILSEKEKEGILETVIGQVQGRVPVYAGTGCVSTAETIRLSKKTVSKRRDVLRSSQSVNRDQSRCKKPRKFKGGGKRQGIKKRMFLWPGMMKVFFITYIRWD